MQISIRSAERNRQPARASRPAARQLDTQYRQTTDRQPGHLQEASAVQTQPISTYTQGRSRLLFAALCAASTLAPCLHAQVVPVVGTSTLNLTPAGGINAGPAVVDACGNVYVNASGNVIEYAANTGAATVIAPDQQGYGGPSSIAIDPSRKFLYFPLGGSTNNQWYSSSWSYVSLNNCVPSGPTTFPATGVSYLFGYYFGTAATMGTDGYGDVFFVPTANNNGTGTNYIAEIACGQTAQASCNGAVPSGANAAVLTAKLSAQPTSLAGDLSGNLYFTTNSGNVYEIAQPSVSGAAKATYTPTIVASGFVDAVAVSTDPAGNLYITDSNGYNSNIYYTTNFKAIVYEVPNESGTLNFAHMYIVSNNDGIAAPPAVDAAGNVYYTSYPPSNEQNLWESVRGAIKVPSSNVGVTTAGSVNFVFNATVTPSTISVNGSNGASVTSTGGTCAAGTAYTAGKSCTVNVNYKPTAPGAQPGTISLLNAGGSPLVSTAVAGTGVGAAVTIDPGAQAAATTTFKRPLGVSVDPNNDYFVADSAANTVTEFLKGSTTGTTLATGTLTLSAPADAVADAQYNVYIADTGNNRIVEVPGSPSGPVSASAVALSISAAGTALKAPTGLAVDVQGNLYIADTGNNRVVFVPNQGGTLGTSAATVYGSGLSAPAAVAVDSTGDLFIADTGNGNIDEITAPLGANNQLKVVSGLSNPTAIAVDAAGSLFVVNQGNASVEKFPLISGLVGSPTYVGGTVPAPFGAGIDLNGNLVITDNTHGLLYGIARTASSLPFGNWNVHATSTPQTASVANGGNGSLVLASPDYMASGATTEFAVSNDSCTGSTLVPGNSCSLSATFTPTKNETNATETLTFSSNAFNTGTLALVGTGETIATSSTTLTLTAPASGSLSAGVSATFTATIGTGSGTANPTGYVTFYVNGSQYGPDVPLSSKAASLTFPNGLPAGSVTVQAVYSGDSNYSGSQGSLNETVIGLNSTLTLTLTTPYTNPQSATDNPASTTGPAIPLTATLAISSKIIPTGTVKFYSGTPGSGTLLGAGKLTPVSGGYQATATENSLRALPGTGTVGEGGSIIDTYSLYAVYSGDNYYVPETSNSVPLIVVGPPSTQAACPTGAKCITNTTGATFIITPSNPTLTIPSSSVNGKTFGDFLLTVTSLGGWAGVLNFSCSNLPAYTTCNPYPGAPLVSASTPSNPALPTTVQFFIYANVPPTPPNAAGFLWWMAGLCGLTLLLARRRLARRGLHTLGTGLALVLLLAASTGAAIGCGSSSSSNVKTPTGTTNVTVSVTAAQLVPGTTNGTVQARDPGTTNFTIALTIQ